MRTISCDSYAQNEPTEASFYICISNNQVFKLGSNENMNRTNTTRMRMQTVEKYQQKQKQQHQ